MFTIKVNGVNLVCEAAGDINKPALILVHGGVCGYEGIGSFQKFDFFQKLAKDYYVIVYDRRNCGRTKGFTPNWTIDDEARDLIGLIEALGLEKASALGVSLGTYVIGRAAILAPHRFHKIILNVPHAYAKGGTPAAQLYAAHGLAPWEDYSNEPEKMKVLAEAMDKASYAPSTTSEMKAACTKTPEEWAYTREEPLTSEQIKIAYNAMGDFDNRPGFAYLEVPTLIMSGTYDGFCPAKVGREIAKLIKNSKYVEFEAGHALLFEKFEECFAAITDFLKD